MLQLTFIKHLDNNNYKDASDSMPKTVTMATKEPPICDVIKVIGMLKVVIFIKLELIKLTQLISVSGNLNESQLEFIATKLVEMFPGESLADFKLCFERGCIGQYGEIFRMDGIVIRKWMEQYLEEKYQVIESELMKERDNLHQIPEQGEGPGYLEFKKWAKTLQDGTKIPGLTDADYRKYGQETPARKPTVTAGYAWFEVRGVKLMATSQEHAEELVELMIKRGDLTEDI